MISDINPLLMYTCIRTLIAGIYFLIAKLTCPDIDEETMLRLRKNLETIIRKERQFVISPRIFHLLASRALRNCVNNVRMVN